MYLRPALLSLGISPTFAQAELQAGIHNANKKVILYFSEPCRVF